ncbi:S24 family peptidase [Phenylobacterium sp.]|uniref:S24 family peptidase n=1 Tax=Phenylobacterium sp. TaxID=1871053 RepID=UPI00272FB6AE|nr:S24 family peptidase [Phenylobacterium sp.]MDP1873603.1 S24 family peptidase [Phenylobacterium sp.]
MDDLLDWPTVAERLNHAPRGARARLAAALRMDRSQLARELRKPRGFPKADQAKIISEFLAGRPVEALAQAPARPGDPMRVPLYGFAAASDGERFAFNDGQILDWIDLPRGMSLKGEFFIVQAIGSSMEPRIWPGERKLVQKGVPPGRDQDAVIEFRDGTAVLKTYVRERDGVVFAQQYNPGQELRYQASDVLAIHAVFPL